MSPAHDWGSIDWLVSAELTPGADLTFGYVEIAPRRENPRHLHPNCDEVLYVIAGVLEHEVGGDVVRLGAGEALHVPRGVPHQARNAGPDTARVVVAYSSGEREMVLAGPSGGSGDASL